MHHLAAHTPDALLAEHSEVLVLELRVSVGAPLQQAAVNIQSRVFSTWPTLIRLWKTISDLLQVWVKRLRRLWG